MYATTGVAGILGISAEQLMGKSFYFCIAENCLSDAVRCLESAKANDSIAYLRFWFRNPLQVNNQQDDSDHGSNDEDEDDGGVPIIRSGVRSEASPDVAIESSPSSRSGRNEEVSVPRLQVAHNQENSRSSSGDSTDMDRRDSDGVFDRPPNRPRSSASSLDPLEGTMLGPAPIEIEACVSCTSDGLVVILRRARPLVPQALESTQPVNYENGLFAAPWAIEPFESVPRAAVDGGVPLAEGLPGTEPEPTPIMTAIRDVAVFAWSLTGINGSIADLAHGQPTGESQPPGGLPIWDVSANAGKEADKYNGFSGGTHRPINQAQVEIAERDEVDGVDIGAAHITTPDKEDPKLEKSIEESSSEDEIVWKRAPTMPEWRRPPRRAHGDAFGSEEPEGKEGEDRAPHSRRRRLDST